MKINCENDYCRYWDDNSCILNEIILDFRGMCRSQIIVNLDEETLKKLRHADLEGEILY